MTKGSTTRDAIIQEALAQAETIGLENLTIGVLADSMGMSKSGLFAHFRSKEALQMAIIETAIAQFKNRVIEPALASRGIVRLESLFEAFIDWIRDEEQPGGCLLTSAAQEYDDRPGPIRDALVESQKGWRQFLAATVTEAVDVGQLPKTMDAKLFVFEFVGITLAYQQALKLIRDRNARSLANAAFARLIRRA